MLVVGRHCGCNCNRAAKGGKNVDDDDAVDAPTTSRVNVIANARRSTILFTARWLNNNSNYGNVIKAASACCSLTCRKNHGILLQGHWVTGH